MVEITIRDTENQQTMEIKFIEHDPETLNVNIKIDPPLETGREPDLWESITNKVLTSIYSQQ